MTLKKFNTNQKAFTPMIKIAKITGIGSEILNSSKERTILKCAIDSANKEIKYLKQTLSKIDFDNKVNILEQKYLRIYNELKSVEWIANKYPNTMEDYCKVKHFAENGANVTLLNY